jgi:hypothetical protein
VGTPEQFSKLRRNSAGVPIRVVEHSEEDLPELLNTLRDLQGVH